MNPSPKKKKTTTLSKCIVRDRKGIQYKLSDKIGTGGQGAVWRVDSPNLAAKILTKSNHSLRDSLNSRIAYVRRLDLSGLNIAQPLESLAEPQCGYIMRFLRDMVSVKSLIRPVAEPITKEWYVATGGLKRRLRIMAKLARLLANLHGRGLIYGDISEENVFISNRVEHNEVWLIDPDNIHHLSQPGGSKGCVYSPGFGAPELVNGTGASSSYSDNYAFAVLCFKVLSLVHPFLGEYVEEGEPELEDATFAGELPWIEDPENTINRTSHGVPRDWVLSAVLRKLFERVFGPGRHDRRIRPSAAEWAEALDKAADATLNCSKCQATYYRNQASCPFCGNSNPIHCLCYLFLWDADKKCPYMTPAGKPKPFHSIVLCEGHSFELCRRLAYGSGSEHDDSPVAILTYQDRKLSVLCKESSNTRPRIVQAGKNIKFSGEELSVALPNHSSQVEIHFGNNDEQHYFFICNTKKSPK